MKSGLDMSEEGSKLQLEAERATEMLRGKTVAVVWRHRSGEVGVQFTDGTRLFVDRTPDGVELSITEGGDSGSERSAG
jgi:hypothetical protein